jgi:hypothetical protein
MTLQVTGTDEASLVADKDTQTKLVTGVAQATQLPKQDISITKIGNTAITSRRRLADATSVTFAINAANEEAAIAIQQKLESVSAAKYNQWFEDAGLNIRVRVESKAPNGLTTAQKIGIAVGVLVALGVLIVASWVWTNKKSEKQQAPTNIISAPQAPVSAGTIEDQLNAIEQQRHQNQNAHPTRTFDL